MVKRSTINRYSSISCKAEPATIIPEGVDLLIYISLTNKNFLAIIKSNITKLLVEIFIQLLFRYRKKVFGMDPAFLLFIIHAVSMVIGNSVSKTIM